MDHLIGMLLGGLMGWTATLLLEHRRWLPSPGDLLAGLIGGLSGSVAATVVGVAGADAAPTTVESLAALVAAGMVIALRRAGHSLVSRRPGSSQTA
jgi:uncharacterized membrane protein YeaQ/YmgE (transglycosylase-associated protein family)